VFGSVFLVCFYFKKAEAEQKGPIQNSFFKAKQLFHSTKITAGWTLLLLR
jgi:hypothetical protein